MNLNKVFVLGRLTADPQLRQTTTGQNVGSFSIATNRVWNDKAGQRQESTEFHNIVVWGRQAEIASQYLRKGGLVLIEGRLQTRSWEDKQGQKRYTTEIVAERLQLGPRLANSGAGRAPAQQQAPSNDQPQAKDNIPTIDLNEGGDEIKKDDLPF